MTVTALSLYIVCALGIVLRMFKLKEQMIKNAKLSSGFTYTALNRVSGAAADANFKSRAFTLTATPKIGSAQAGDRCGALVIKHDGTQSADANSCWE